MKNKVSGFLLLESITALIIAILGVSSVALIVGSGQKNEHVMELRTDRAYAWHMLTKNKLTKITIHDHVYELASETAVYDKNEKKVYEVKK